MACSGMRGPLPHDEASSLTGWRRDVRRNPGPKNVNPIRAMELLAILNRCHYFQGFVYQQAYFSADKKSTEVGRTTAQGFGCKDEGPWMRACPIRHSEARLATAPSLADGMRTTTSAGGSSAKPS